MSLSPTTLLGNSLVFERAGQVLVAVDPDAIAVVELGAAGHTRRIPIAGARAVAAFADQLWIASHDDQLVRVDHTGRPLGAPSTLPFSARAALLPAPCGPPAAVWSSQPALALLDDFGQLVSTELAGVDLALPLTGRRLVTARGARLTLLSGLVTTLPPNTTVLGGAVMADGKTVTLLVSCAGGRQLLVVSLGTGQIAQRCTVQSSTLRLATRAATSCATTTRHPSRWPRRSASEVHHGQEPVRPAQERTRRAPRAVPPRADQVDRRRSRRARPAALEGVRDPRRLQRPGARRYRGLCADDALGAYRR